MSNDKPCHHRRIKRVRPGKALGPEPTMQWTIIIFVNDVVYNTIALGKSRLLTIKKEGKEPKFMYFTRIHALPSFPWPTKDKIDLFCGQGQVLAFSLKCATQEITPRGPWGWGSQETFGESWDASPHPRLAGSFSRCGIEWNAAEILSFSNANDSLKKKI